MVSWRTRNCSLCPFDMVVSWTTCSKCATSAAFLTGGLFQFLYWSALSMLFQTSIYPTAIILTRAQLLLPKWRLNVAAAFSKTVLSGYMTKAPHVVVEASLSEYIWITTMTVLGCFDLLSFWDIAPPWSHHLHFQDWQLVWATWNFRTIWESV